MSKKKKIISSKKELRESLRDSSGSESLILSTMTRLFSPSKRMADNSTAAVQGKEAKEKLPEIEVVKSPAQKEIPEGLERREVDSDSEVEKKNLSAEVLHEEKETKKNPEKKDTKKSLFDKGLNAAGMQGDKEVSDEFYETFNDEEKLGKKINEFEKLKNNKSWLLKVLGKGGSGDSATKEQMGDIIDKYVSDERIETKDGKQWKMKTFEEVMGKGKLNWFQTLWLQFKHPIEFGMWKAAQEQAKYLRFGKSAERFSEKAEEVKEEGQEKLEYGKEVFDQTKEEQRKVLTQMRVVKLENKEKLKEVTKFKNKWNADMKNANMNIAKLGPEKYSEKIADISKKGVRDVNKIGPEAVKAVGAGKVPGMNIKKVGAASVISVGVMTMKAALRSRSFGEFGATVTNSSWLWSAAELLPIVGTIRSAQRLNNNSLGTSKGMRWAELGINLGLDAFTVLTLGTGAGIAAGARLALKGGTKVAVKVGAKALAKKAGKELLEEGAEAGIKAVAKKEAGNVSNKVVAGSIAKTGAKATQQSALATMKTTFSKITGKTWKKVWGHMPWKHAGYEGVSEGASWSFNKFGPRNKTFAQAAVDVGMKQVLTKNQTRVINMVRGGARKAA